MKKRYLDISLTILIILSWNAVLSLAQQKGKWENNFTPQLPRYELKLNLNEFSVLNGSALLGITKYGGEAEYTVKMAKVESDVLWTVTTANLRLMEAWSYWIAEKSLDLVHSIDADSLDFNNRLSLKTIKSLSSKVTDAQQNPLWDLIKLSGRVVEDKGVWFIEGEQGKYQVTGGLLEEVKKMTGRPIIAGGFIKIKDQIEVTAFLPKKENVLELFVMGLCPFGKAAESFVLNYLDSVSVQTKPSLEIHYIFYKTKNEAGETVFTSLHGEEEVKENLVQIVIRDAYPQFYHDYLLQRATHDSLPWRMLAKELRMKDEDIKSIELTIEKEREKLIQKEYDYVTGTYGIYDGSPAYAWESERIVDVRQVEFFKGRIFSSDTCFH